MLGCRAQLGDVGSSLEGETAKLSILYLETALEQINATALLPDKILFQVPAVLMAFRVCFDSPAGSCPKKSMVVSLRHFPVLREAEAGIAVWEGDVCSAKG